jgi:DNA topoisomerase-2
MCKDGLKPAQRKVLYGCFKRNLKYEIKLVQLAGYIAELTAYHHGEAALHNTIIAMAQDFVGSNNVPYLIASGQFGTRSLGGSDAASPRYIFTQMSPITRALFPAEDDGIINIVINIYRCISNVSHLFFVLCLQLK